MTVRSKDGGQPGADGRERAARWRCDLESHHPRRGLAAERRERQHRDHGGGDYPGNQQPRQVSAERAGGPDFRPRCRDTGDSGDRLDRERHVAHRLEPLCGILLEASPHDAGNGSNAGAVFR